ncbi:MAG: hypothetical protein ACRDN8_27985, partial [Thermoleophilaceae bacterium]
PITQLIYLRFLRSLRDIVALRGEQNRQRGTMVLQLRLGRPVPKKRSRVRFDFTASAGDHWLEADIYMGAVPLEGRGNRLLKRFAGWCEVSDRALGPALGGSGA